MTARTLQPLLLSLCWLLLALPLYAQERILSYDETIDIRPDGSLDVTERITVRAEGNQIRRGIYRDIPTRYDDRYGNRVVVALDVVDVKRDGKTEPWFTERRSNGLRINTGNDNFLPVPAEYTYTLRYRASRQLGFFADHDELYWNAIGTGWIFPIERGSVEVRLPRAVPTDQLRAEGYTGAQGEQGDDFVAELPAAGIARWKLTRPLMPEQGFTVVLSFPKDLVVPPSGAQKLRWFLKDNRGVLVALAGLLLMIGYCVRRWFAVGRDPRKGVVIARYEPPEGESPAGLRYVSRMGYDTRCFSSDLLALAVEGDVRIHREKGVFKDDWELEKLDTADTALDPERPDEARRTLLRGLFPGGMDRLELRDTNAATVAGAQASHAAVLKKRYQPAMFDRNGGSIAIAFVIGLAAIVLAFVVSGGSGVLAIIAFMILMLIVLAVFGVLIKAHTIAGRKLLDEIEGLKTYLGVAERDELARMPGPDQPPMLDAKRYERLLPYAVALEVEDAWTKKFTLAVGAAAAAATTAAIGWYRGDGASDLGSLSKAIGSSLSSQIASSSSPPGSSSGSGGGGSSGGGGGGGGGGGR